MCLFLTLGILLKQTQAGVGRTLDFKSSWEFVLLNKSRCLIYDLYYLWMTRNILVQPKFHLGEEKGVAAKRKCNGAIKDGSVH